MIRITINAEQTAGNTALAQDIKALCDQRGFISTVVDDDNITDEDLLVMSEPYDGNNVLIVVRPPLVLEEPAPEVGDDENGESNVD